MLRVNLYNMVNEEINPRTSDIGIKFETILCVFLIYSLLVTWLKIRICKSRSMCSYIGMHEVIRLEQCYLLYYIVERNYTLLQIKIVRVATLNRHVL